MAVEPSAKEKAVSWCHEKTRNDVVMENIGLVYLVLKRFQDRGYETEELFQIGTEGLIKAVERFDPGKGFAFSTYAVPLIAGEIKRFLRDDGLIKVSRSLKENSYHIMKATEKFVQEYNRQPTMHEIAEITGLSDEEIVMAMEVNTPVESIYQTVYQSDGNEIFLVDQISQNGHMGGSTNDKNDLEKDKLLNHILIRELLEKLDDDERKLIQWRFYEEKTQTEIAQMLHINQVQVCRMEKRIVRKMREMAME